MSAALRIKRPRRAAALGWVLAAVGLAGCNAIPDEGPSTRAIADRPDSAQGEAARSFVVITVDADVVQRLAASPIDTGSAVPNPPPDAALPQGRSVGLIGVGDLLHVAVWEPDQSGASLLDHAALELNARVGPDGAISLPYAGRIAAAGEHPAAVERTIVSRLSAQTVSPQASVLVAEDQTNDVLVAGNVAHPGRLPLAADARLSDAIALAGGPRVPDLPMAATIERQGTVLHVAIDQDNPSAAANLMLAPGDRINVTALERRFYAFGAVNRPGEQAFHAGTMTVADALGRIAGLQDGRANPAGLFVFRRQAASLTRSLLSDQHPSAEALTQVVYRINLRDPSAFFWMSAMLIQPRDIVYVSNAPLAELGKFASILSGINSVASTPRNFGAY